MIYFRTLYNLNIIMHMENMYNTPYQADYFLASNRAIFISYFLQRPSRRFTMRLEFLS